jgi:hypothetical protein
MMRKSVVKKISAKTKKKETKKKVSRVSKSPQKTAEKKKQVKRVVLNVKGKKTQARKRKTAVQMQEKEDKKRKKTERKPKTITEKAVSKKAVSKSAMKKTSAKAPVKTSGKAAVPPKAEKPSKSIKVKSTAKPDRKEELKKLKKITKEIPEKLQKKIIPKEAVKLKASKSLKRLPQKRAVSQAKKKEAENFKEPEKIEQPKAVRKPETGKKLTQQKLREVKQIMKSEILKEPKEVTAVPEFKKMKADTRATGYLPAEVTSLPVPLATLPSEYGENSITLMTVNPYKIFAFWEVRKETLDIFKGALHLRVYDITGIDLDTADAHSFHDMEVSERVGKMYIDVSPSKEYIVDINIVYNGILITIARSSRVSTPSAGVQTEEEFPQKVFDDGIRIGY